MKKLLSSILLTISLSAASAQTFNPLLANMLQDTLNFYATAITSIKGMSASVYYPGQGVWQGTSGISYTGAPVTKDMAFGIASNTKLFVATTMLKLQEDGIIDLDDPISTWLPTYPNVDPAITVRQLLNHTSGVSDPIFLPPWMDTIMANPTRVFPPEEVLSWLGAPFFAPGTGWGYSNVNYVLAGMIAESATGMHISELIRDDIFTPLDMDSSFYDVEEPETGTIAHRWYNLVDFNDTSRVGLNTAGGAAGAIFSTGSEMAQWYHALMSGEIINETSLAQLTDFVETGIPYYDYGLGFSRETTLTKTYWGHGGTTWGYRSKMMYHSCRGAVVCGLVNSWPAGEESVVYLLYSVIDNHLPYCGGAIAGLTEVCQGTIGVTYTVPPIAHATSYLWSLPGGATGLSVSNTITVDYGLTAVSGNISVEGVSDYGNGPAGILAIMVNPVPPIPTITQTGSTLHSSAPAGNQWYNTAGLIPGATAPDYNITAEDDYYVIVTLAGCSSDASEIMHAQPLEIAVANAVFDIQIYPNPVTDICTLKAKAGIEISYDLYNPEGQLLQGGQFTNTISFSLHNLPAGIYMLRLKTENKMAAILVEKI